MTQIRVQLVGEAVGNVPVAVQLIGPPETNTAHGPDGEIVSDYRKLRTDSAGLLTLDLTPTDELFPAGCFYRVTAFTLPRATWNIYLTAANAPAGPYDIGAAALQVLSPVPPGWVPVATVIDIDLVGPLIGQYLDENPDALTAALEAALEDNPRALIDGSNITDGAAFRLAIGAASDTDLSAQLTLLSNRLAALELVEATSPAVRAPGYAAVTVSESDGVPYFDFT